jgi:hypothetical protein
LQAHHSMEARPLNLARPEVPEELAAVVRKMMAKDPAQRYQTPAEVAQALSVFVKQGAKGGAAPKSPDLSAGAAGAQPAQPLAPAAEGANRKAATTEMPSPVAWDTLTEGSTTSAEPRKSGAVRKRRPPAAKPSKRMWLLGTRRRTLYGWKVCRKRSQPSDLADFPDQARNTGDLPKRSSRPRFPMRWPWPPARRTPSTLSARPLLGNSAGGGWRP